MGVLGKWFAGYLSQPVSVQTRATSFPDLLRNVIQPGDVLLVEGNTRISTAIKYLTQSTWSHAALYIGDHPAVSQQAGAQALIEADLKEGIRAVPLQHYQAMHTRICRPVGLTPHHLKHVIEHAVARLGYQYDLRNVIDLARYLMPTPPVPSRWRRRMLALGSGDPTRAICSTLIAQSFQSVRYPILPLIELIPHSLAGSKEAVREIARIRHHSLFTPRDFDISPYFQIIKPALSVPFNYQKFPWGLERQAATPPAQ